MGPATEAGEQTPGSNTSTNLVKIAVTVDGKSQLLVLDQSESLEGVIGRLCAEHGLKWKQGWFALQFVHSRRTPNSSSRGVPSAGLTYVTEENRGEIKNGAELKLTYAPGVYSDIILERLSSSKRHPEDRSWGFAKLAALSPDPIFLSAFAAKSRAVDQVLAHLRSEGRDDRLNTRELQSVLRVVFWLLHHGILSAVDSAVIKRVASLVRADYTVDSDVLVTSLKILAELSLPPWDMAVVREVSMIDLVPLLWDQERPVVQTAALEVMTILAAREARDGPKSPEGTANVSKMLTSPQVRDSIARYVLPNPVDSDMARQLFALQSLLLRPLRESLRSAPPPDHPALTVDPISPPPQLPARKRSKSNPQFSYAHSRSWTPPAGTPATPEADGKRPPSDPSATKWSSLDTSVTPHYKILGSVTPIVVSRGPSTVSSRPVSGQSDDVAGKRLSGDSLGSLGSYGAASTASLASQDSGDTTNSWQGDSDEAPPPPLGLSLLGAECLQYLRSKHPSVANSAAAEEEAMRGSLNHTAERLVRVLAEELRLCEDHTPAYPVAPAPGPAPASLSASTLSLLPAPTAAEAPLPLSPTSSPPPPEPPSLRTGSEQDSQYQPLVFLTADDEPFFQELFCLGVNLLAKTRREMRARTARDQEKVFRVVQRQFREALKAQVRSWGQLEDWLSELPYSAVAALWERERAAAERSTVLGSAAALQLREARTGDILQLVRQQRIATLRAGARFYKLAATKGKRSASESGYTFAWLGQGDNTLQYADCTEESKVLGAPKVLPLASVTAVVTGRKHAYRSKKLASFPAFSLLLDPYDCEMKSIDFVAPDVRTMEHWVDGFNILLGKEPKSASVKRDADCLMDMEMRLQLMELDGLPIPSEPPEVPPPPPNFNFVT